MVKSSPDAKKKKGSANWRDRQAIVRELQSAERIASTLKLFFTHFDTDTSSVSLGEAVGIEKKLEARLKEDIRWIYQGDDIDQKEPSAAEEVQKRHELLETMREGESKLGAMIALLRSNAATLEKDPQSYDYYYYSSHLIS